MTDLADQLNDIEVPLTAQSKAQRKRDDEVNSLHGTDLAGLAEEVMNFDLATDHVRLPRTLAMKLLDRNPPSSEHVELLQFMCLEDVRASLRAKEAKKRNCGRVGGNGGIMKRDMVIRGGRPGKVRSETKDDPSGGNTETKLVIRGGPPSKVGGDSKVHADRRASEASKEAYRKRPAPVESSNNYKFDSERLEHEAWLQRGGRSWSTEAVAGNANGDANDKYACFS